MFTEQDILSFFDDALDKGQWPELLGSQRDRAYYAMRLIAVRSTDSWGLLFERAEGEGWDANQASPYAFAPSAEQLGWVRRALFDLSEDTISLDDESAAEEAARRGPFSIEGIELTGPAGGIALEDRMIGELDLRPGKVTARGVTLSRYSLCVRAYLASYPGSLYRDPLDILCVLEMPKDARVLFVAQAFEHCVGPDGPAEYPGAWRLRPSESKVYQSLARALVAGDASRFEPGQSNLDWRLHALVDTGERAPSR